MDAVLDMLGTCIFNPFNAMHAPGPFLSILPKDPDHKCIYHVCSNVQA